jgi:hypothetical protein
MYECPDLLRGGELLSIQGAALERRQRLLRTLEALVDGLIQLLPLFRRQNGP